MMPVTRVIPGVFLLPWVLLAPDALAAEPTPETARIAKIYNIEKSQAQSIDVRFFRKNECPEKDWCRVSGSGEYLKDADWLLTGNVSRADLALMYDAARFKKVLFWQHEKSRSQFEPKPGTCHFKVDTGGFLYAHPHQGADPGCRTIASDNALVFPNGTALFIASSEDETLVGVLSSGPDAPVRVQHRASGKHADVTSGFFAKALPNGGVQVGEFNLADFYRNHALGRGLGPDQVDEDYIARQEPEIRDIIRPIRKDTLAALEEQKRAGPRDWISIADLFTDRTPPSYGSPQTPPPVTSPGGATSAAGPVGSGGQSSTGTTAPVVTTPAPSAGPSAGISTSVNSSATSSSSNPN